MTKMEKDESGNLYKISWLGSRFSNKLKSAENNASNTSYLVKFGIKIGKKSFLQ